MIMIIPRIIPTLICHRPPSHHRHAAALLCIVIIILTEVEIHIIPKPPICPCPTSRAGAARAAGLPAGPPATQTSGPCATAVRSATPSQPWSDMRVRTSAKSTRGLCWRGLIMLSGLVSSLARTEKELRRPNSSWTRWRLSPLTRSDGRGLTMTTRWRRLLRRARRNVVRCCLQQDCSKYRF